MPRYSISVFCALLLGSTTNAVETADLRSTANSSNELIAHLPMDGSIVDKVSGATPTTITGTSPTEGKIGGAIHFDGTAFVQLPVDLSPQAHPELTITMWVRPDPLPEDPVLRKWFYPNAYLVSDGDGMLMIGNQQKDILYFGAYSTGAAISNSNHPGMRGGWQLLAITRRVEDRTTDNGDVRPHTVLTLYSNGRVSESAGIQHDKTIKPYISLGASSAGSSGKFHGAIDDVRAYSKALSPEEIRTVTAAEPGADRDVGRAATNTGSAGGNSTGAITTYGGPVEMGIDATSVEPSESSQGDQTLGLGDSSSWEPSDRFGQLPTADDIVGSFDDDEARREAAAEIAVDGSPLPDALPPSAVDTTATNDGADFEAPVLVTDQRAEAEPGAGAGAIGANNPTFTPPVSTADETEELIASDDGRALLQSADWRIEGMVPNSADKTELYPGDEVTIKIRISKDDPANKIPDVRLVTNVGPGTPSPSYNLTINTAEANPTEERDIPITLPVPENLEFAEGSSQVSWRPRVWLNTQAGMPLRDATTDNHSRELALIVMNGVANNNCTEVVEREDGTRVTRPCLDQEGSTVQVYIDHSILVSTNLKFAGDHEDDARELMVFENTQGALRQIRIKESEDKPCDIVIGDSFDGYMVSDQCTSRSVLTIDSNHDLNVGDDRVITGLKVCRNDADNRLKGFQVETREILQDGSLSISTKLESEVTHPNCAKWTAFSRCATGTAAAGLEVMWNTGTRYARQDFIHSIDLMCGEVLLRAQET